MLEPLGRCRRHSTLFQFASNGLRDFIDPSKGARSAASVQWPGVSSPGCPLNALSRSAPLAGPQDFRWRWTVAPRMSAAAAFLPLFWPWVSRSSPREPKPRSDLSAGRYGWLCGGARPPPSPESFGHRGRGQLPPLPGAPAPVSSEGPDQGHHEHPERTTRTNTRNEQPERTPGCGACVRPGQCRSGCPSPPPPSPGPSRTAWLHSVAGLSGAATRRTPVWSATATAFRPDLPPRRHAVSQPLGRPPSSVPGVGVGASMPARTGDRPHALRPVQSLPLRRPGVPSCRFVVVQRFCPLKCVNNQDL